MSKFIDNKLYWIRDRTRLGDFIPTHIQTENNSADYQIKNLSTKEHDRQVRNYVKFSPPNPDNPSLKPSVCKKNTVLEYNIIYIHLYTYTHSYHTTHSHHIH